MGWCSSGGVMVCVVCGMVCGVLGGGVGCCVIKLPVVV